MGGGNASNPGQDIGAWGQFDPFRTGDAARFEYSGGDQALYQGLTPAQKDEWARGMREGGFEGPGGWQKKAKQFVTRARANSPTPQSSPQGGLPPWMSVAAPGGQAPSGPGNPGSPGMAGVPANEYMRAATPNTSNPWGGTSWTEDANGNLTQSNTLSPGMEGANKSLEAMYAKLLGQGQMTGDAARQQAIDSAYGQATSRLDPQWSKREEALRTQLLNQGLDPTSEAGRNSMSDFGQQRNDAYSSAMNSAIGIGNQAGNDVFRNNLQAMNQPLQQMALIKALSQSNANPSLLNALIAQKNNELGLAGQAQQAQSDWINAATQLAGAGLNYFK